MNQIMLEKTESVHSQIHGEPNKFSKTEMNVYNAIVNAMSNHPNTKCEFYINLSLVDLGVPSKAIRPSDFQQDVIDFMMMRCKIDREDAVTLFNLLEDKYVRTNSLQADLVKAKNGKIISAVELNRGTHYRNQGNKKKFARQLFNDFIKITELKKITEYVEIDMRIQDIYGVGSIENQKMSNTLYNIINDLD